MKIFSICIITYFSILIPYKKIKKYLTVEYIFNYNIGTVE
ncbi:hypothetical protein HMPREF9094_0221 [Fusobacterium animalis ATCC 51191]|uniref:Uncharacterized protein n=1 Tax=Fusobacterium animalis ATCC 51191 TaxID=997347 RepID=F9EJW7_9FUSO|nr:hypothetical protein HMPREF9094_0221 [Fusobacterium animalis ATCC 51191]